MFDNFNQPDDCQSDKERDLDKSYRNFDELKMISMEGITIRPEVELDDIEVIYCHKDYQQKMVEWCKTNAAHIRVVSIEVTNLILEYNEI